MVGKEHEELLLADFYRLQHLEVDTAKVVVGDDGIHLLIRLPEHAVKKWQSIQADGRKRLAGAMRAQATNLIQIFMNWIIPPLVGMGTALNNT